MRKRKLISFADDQSIAFFCYGRNGKARRLAVASTAACENDTSAVNELSAKMPQGVNQLLVVPDYWLGSRADAFLSRKQSLAAPFVERKLKQDASLAPEAAEFYEINIVPGPGHDRALYTYYLQDATAHQLYHCLDSVGLAPRRITTPALLWKTYLEDHLKGFDQERIGLIHLSTTDCRLYLYFSGQFLFSRLIELPGEDVAESERYNRLHYEIKQSLYLYSQKTKNQVNDLFLISGHAVARDRLTELLGREIKALGALPSISASEQTASIPPACIFFSAEDFFRPTLQAVSYHPLKKVLYWRPVQWAGIAVGLVLTLLLGAESIYLHSLSAKTAEQMAAVRSLAPPEQIIQETTQAIDRIQRSVNRLSGAETLMRTFLSLPDAVSMEIFSVDFTTAESVSLDAVVRAQNPEAFRSVFQSLLVGLNEAFSLQANPLREKDAQIFLERSRQKRMPPMYRVRLQFGLSR